MYTIFNKFADTLFRAVERHDLSRWEHEPEDMPEIYGFYHVYCSGPWREMAAAQMSRLRGSGLLEVTRRLYVSCIPTEEGDTGELMAILGTGKAELIAVTPPPGRYEYPALRYARQLCADRDCLVYYFHTKGVSYYPADGVCGRRLGKFLRNVTSWRGMMEWALFDKWRVAVNTLTGGYDTYGCYRLPPRPKKYYMYAGNFWWARGGYLRTLPEITGSDMRGRYYAEEWLYRGCPRDFSAFDTMADLYYVNMPSCLYAARRLPVLKAAAFVLRYNLHKFEKHVLRVDFDGKYKHAYQKRMRIK